MSHFTPELISGTVSDLKILAGRHNFVTPSTASATAGTAAAGAAIVGSFFASSLLARAAIGLNEDAVFFTCTLNGIPLSGCFNTLNITEGDNVDMVVEYNADKTEGVVYCIRNPQTRCLWIVPMMENGHKIVQKLAFTFPATILACVLPIGFIFIVIITTLISSWDETLELLPSLLIGIFVIAGGLGFTAMSLGHHVTLVPKAKQATKVIAALGFTEPERVSFGEVSHQAITRWEKENQKPFPRDNYDDYTFFY